ncbi:MAG: hypothetical protein LBL93_02555, partial [Ruminococcus sp.]|nr:hypothetical protein [Ruminococcus sp.]
MEKNKSFQDTSLPTKRMIRAANIFVLFIGVSFITIALIMKLSTTMLKEHEFYVDQANGNNTTSIT